MKTRLAVTLALLATLSFGQNLQVTISPNPAPLGVPINFTANDAYNLGLWTSGNNNILAEVRSGSPAGPTVVPGFPTSGLPGAIPPCGQAPRPGQWTPAASITPGDYWVAIAYNFSMFGGGNYIPEWFCVSIEDPMSPRPTLAVSAGSTPAIGTTYLMDITAPGHTVDTYICAMSASTNVGLPLGMGIHFALDIDPIFDLSFPSPHPAVFSNFQGMTDASGNATGIGFTIPNLPFLSCIPLHCQALIIPFQSTLPVEATNVHNFVIQ